MPHRHVSAWLSTVDDSDVAVSALTVREVAKGVGRLAVRKPEEAAQIEARTEAVFDAFDGRILPVDRSVAQAWGRDLAQSEKHADDAGIAATARMHGLVLVTRNVRDVAHRDVAVLNPFKLPPERLP